MKTAALVAAGLLILAARRPEDVVAAEFTAEEGNAFYLPTFFVPTPELVASPWGGYLQVVPRLGYELVSLAPVAWAPLVENLVAFLIVAAVGAYVASPRLSHAIPDPRARLLLGGLLLVLPGQTELHGSIVNTQWFLALWLVALAVTADPTSRIGQAAERGAAALVAASGPFSALLAPLFWFRLRTRTRNALWLAAIVTAGGLVQLAMAAGSREVGAEHDAPYVVANLVIHAVGVPLVGERVGQALADAMPLGLVAVALAVGAGTLAVIGLRRLPPAGAALAYSAAGLAFAGLAVHQVTSVWEIHANSRYFLLATALVACVVVAGAVRRDRLALALVPVLAVGILGDFRLQAPPRQGWDERGACIGGADPCVVPVWPRDYDLRWPGLAGEYVPPEHIDP